MNTRNGNDQEQAAPPETQEDQSRSFRLRAEHPRVTRLSRKVLGGGAPLHCSSSVELFCGRCRTIVPETRRPTSFTVPIITMLPTALRRCRRIMLVFRASQSRNSVRRSLATSVDRSLPLKASRRRSAVIRNSNAGIRDRSSPHQSSVRSDQWTGIASARRCGCWKRPRCATGRNGHRRRWICAKRSGPEACLRERLC